MIRQPDFIGIGQQKCGTSWIAACLDDHPNIQIPIKEPHFFSKEEEWQKGLDYYFSLYSRVPEDSLAGEFSTTYFDAENALDRIAERCPNSKILLSLRSPYSRTISSIYNDIMAGILPKDTDITDHLTPESIYVKRSLYADKIEKLYRLFPAENIHIMLLEESRISPDTFIENLYKFLEVDSRYRSDFLRKTINKSNIPHSVLLSKFMGFTSTMMRRLGMQFIVVRLKKTGLVGQLHSMNSKSISRPDISLPNNVQKRLAQDICQLEKILGFSLAIWNGSNVIE